MATTATPFLERIASLIFRAKLNCGKEARLIPLFFDTFSRVGFCRRLTPGPREEPCYIVGAFARAFVTLGKTQCSYHRETVKRFAFLAHY